MSSSKEDLLRYNCKIHTVDGGSDVGIEKDSGVIVVRSGDIKERMAALDGLMRVKEHEMMKIVISEQSTTMSCRINMKVKLGGKMYFNRNKRYDFKKLSELFREEVNRRMEINPELFEFCTTLEDCFKLNEKYEVLKGSFDIFFQNAIENGKIRYIPCSNVQ